MLSSIRPANAIDFWRGFALVSIFLNHIPGGFYERLTHRNYSISDSAELFVFLAGWSLRRSVGPRNNPLAPGPLVMKLGGRVLRIYMAQLVIIVIAIAMLAATAKSLDNPLVLEWHNAASVFYDPINTHIGLVLLTHHLGYFDILPLYVAVMLCAPLFALIDRYARHALIPASLALYFASLAVPLNLPSWPVQGQWLFNPLTWQAIFVLGFVLAEPDTGFGAWARRNIWLLRWLSVPVVLVGIVMSLAEWGIDPTRVPEPRLFFIDAKTYQSPIRLIHFLALAALVSALSPLILRHLTKLTSYFSLLGRNSLYVFCVGSLASLLAQIVRFASGGGLTIDTVVVVFGLGVMTFSAWASDRRERTAASL